MPDNPSPPAHEDTAVEEVLELLEAGQAEQALSRLADLHPADQAGLIARLDEPARTPLLPRIPRETLADILGYLEEEPRRDIVAELDPTLLGGLLDQVDRDVAVDVLHELPDEGAQAVLASMTTRADVAPLLVHEDETAGGRMTSDYISLNKEWTVDQALSHLRRTRPEADQVFYLYAVDSEHRLQGVVSLRGLIVAGPEERVEDLMTPDVVSVSAGEDQEETARRVQRYNFIALPVVDEERRLMGVVGIDDLIDVVEEEATEDMYRMAGLDEEESLLRPAARSIAPRLAWLLVALVSVSAAAAVVNSFEGTIERVAALAMFMPVIAGLAGNAGVQTITLVVRSLALGHVEMRDVGRVLTREVAVGVANGVVIGLLVGAIAFAWKGNVGLATVAGAAMLFSMTTAVAAGVCVPLVLRALRLDPALASGVFVTTLTDVVGLFFFLGLATLLVEWVA